MRERQLSRSLFLYKLNRNRMWSRSPLFKSRFSLPGPPAGKGRFSGIIRVIFKRAEEKPGVNPLATAPSLRRRFATHLLEKGVNLRYIQALAGARAQQDNGDLYQDHEKRLGQDQKPTGRLRTWRGWGYIEGANLRCFGFT